MGQAHKYTDAVGTALEISLYKIQENPHDQEGSYPFFFTVRALFI